MNWTQLSPQDTANFLKAVADKNEPTIFDSALCEVHTLPLSFYDGYHLTRIVNRHMMPYLLLDYLSNGENHYYLDGSESAFHNLNARHAISLDETNALDYLSLYISYVYERGNSFEFFQEPQDGFETKLLGIENEHYQLTAPLFYQGKTVQAMIDVEQNGAIHIRKPINVSFLTDLKPGENITYRHPLEAKIIEETKALLDQTATGKRLLQKSVEFGVDIRVLNSPNYQGYVTNDRKTYILMPAVEQTAKYLQAIVLTFCLRDAEQISHGLIREPYTGERSPFISSNYGKNLDIIVEMCKIVSEYEEQGIAEGRLELESMELGNVYKAFQNNADSQELLRVYLNSLEKAGLFI